MQLKDFYERVLPPTGRYALFQNRRNSFYDTLDGLVAATEKRINTQGLYFATASYGDLRAVDKDGNELDNYARTQENVVALKALRIDIDAGAEKFAKHPTGAYPTQRDAMAALIGAIKGGLRLPTLIVSSGEGLHVYWCLGAPVPRALWRAAAEDFQVVCAGRFGLRVDSSCTSDEARVLRPVGTLHKNGNRVAVLKDTGRAYDATELFNWIAGELPDEPVPLPPRRVSRAPSVNDDILVPVEGPPASLARVAEHCSAVAAMRDSNGNVPEPHWRAVMGVAKYCIDGEELVHTWSSGYQGYSRRETQEKFDRWETPPTTCQHFSLMHSGCATCPYRSKITTPKQVGYIAAAPTASAAPIPDAPASAGTPTSEPEPTPDTDESSGMALPDEPASAECPVPERPDLFDEASPFFYRLIEGRWTLHHKYKEQTKDATGQTVWVEHVKAVAYKLFWVDSNTLPGASDSGGVVVRFGRIERPGSARQDRMDMPAGVSADVKTLCKFLVDQGINIAPRSINKNATEHVKEYVNREIIRKQNDMRFVIKDRFGYHFHEGQFICSLGAYTVYPDGVILKTICNSKLHGLAKSITTTALEDMPSGRWEPTVWKEVAPAVAQYIRFLRKHYGHAGYEAARLAIAINLASPFLVFAADSVFSEAEEMPATGFVLSLYSQASGIGKTSLMTSIAAAYGKDTLARKGNDQSITAVAAATTAKNTAIYPFLLDEVTQNEAARAAQLIDTFANGTGRLRARSDGSVSKSAETWALVSCVATNVPLRELLTASQKKSDALLMRLMELDFDEIPAAGDVDSFRADLKAVQEQCGAFGLFQALLAVKAGHRKLTEMTAANVTRAFELLGVGQQFRFFARMLGAMLTSQELLGTWAPFDMDELVATFKRAIRDTMWYVQAQRQAPDNELGQLLAALSPHVVVTKTWAKRVGRQDVAHDVVMNPNVRMPILGREVQDWGMVLLDAGAVRNWCLEQQMSASAFIKKMDAAGLLVTEGGKDKVKSRLTTGLAGMPTINGYYYKFRTRPADADEAGTDNVVELRPSLNAVERPAVETAGAS